METTITTRRELFFHVPGTQEPMCDNCAYYYPHYREDGCPLFCGHCVRPRMKLRKAYDLCKQFKNKEDT